MVLTVLTLHGLLTRSSLVNTCRPLRHVRYSDVGSASADRQGGGGWVPGVGVLVPGTGVRVLHLVPLLGHTQYHYWAIPGTTTGPCQTLYWAMLNPLLGHAKPSIGPELASIRPEIASIRPELASFRPELA